MLSPKEKHRYSRHLLLDGVGEEGQTKLKNSSVLVIGAGGLGCPVLQYLGAAGVGKIGIIDFDVVDETNLQRQILYSVNDIGQNKAVAAAEKITALNPQIEIEAIPEKLTTQNAENLFKEYDIIVDGSDSFATRYLVNDTCVKMNKPLVYGAIYQFEGQVSVFNYDQGPSYRCLFPEPPSPDSVGNCSEVGVLGVLPGLIGTMQANEVLKVIIGYGDVLSGRLQIIDSKTNSSNVLTITRNQNEIDKVLNQEFIIAQQNYEVFCGLGPAELELNAEEGIQLVEAEGALLIDVRESHETPKLTNIDHLQIPLSVLENRTSELESDKSYVIFCQSGMRSKKATRLLRNKYHINRTFSLSGGIPKLLEVLQVS